MHYQASRLVDHHQVRILVDHLKRHGLGLEGLTLGGGAQFELQHVPHFDFVRLLAQHPPVDLRGTRIHQLLHIAARKLRRQKSQGAVQPLAMLGQRHRSCTQL